MNGQALAGSGVGLRPLPDDEIRHWRRFPAHQQPEWHETAEPAVKTLTELPGLVDEDEVDTFGALLAEAASGALGVVQAGDCAEDPGHCVPERLAAKAELLRTLAAVLTAATGRETVTVGRIAGQFAKPRSRATEVVDGVALPSFRGLMVNAPDPDPAARRPDPGRLLICYAAARTAVEFLREHTAPGEPHRRIWTSHEALVLDYELPLARRTPDGRLLLTSTHWPWVGDRTRDPEGAHVRLLAEVANPVACKVGPTMTTAALLRLCALLDPHRTPGRLTLIARMGPGQAARRLPGLVAAVRAAGHPVLWLCDPLHANTITAPDGLKTRVVATAVAEIRAFCAAVQAAGGVAGGLHLEATPEPVAECLWHASEVRPEDPAAYTTLCDPRLNRAQALAAVEAWRCAGAPGTEEDVR
ncbi:3-deoxy-7-phosphoheptulonate synthase [Streptomyces cynarae]|uniref:Phospho-2-dehydro-3-deoxyheptonate aldolase n=1 Tax=Streptomyces cynarae TaxID=2981134 RepID=A0ABY6E9S5_9ACTN|nr:3-deoxy-7-phosphoheptulonate synthase [Streptomyces cynarae]UXY22628.1 3-deoxy-7-phosphoheptulonate synthase [Streptomyces cynarae]